MTSMFNLGLKCVLKTGKNTIFWPLSKNFRKSFLECQKKSSGFINIRPLSTAVGNVEKSTENNVSETSKKENSIIYLGMLTHQIKGVKVLTCVSSLGGIALQPLMVSKLSSGTNSPLSIALFITVGFFTFVTPFLFHFVTKKYVTEIRYNSTTDTYTATVLSFFLRRININFKVEDVKVPIALSMFTTMYIKGKPVFVNTESFLEPKHYIKIMGYDKPMDFSQINVKHDSNEHNK